ncbi:MAG: hypothetical protein KF715_19735 [Candidatus Didemnitutus sp.]|nr:hypothetical protein [Candidatus Didemnitutus sp.]
MKPSFNLVWFNTPTGQLVLVIALTLFAAGAVAWRKTQRNAPPVATRTARTATSLPRVFAREAARFVQPVAPPNGTPAPQAGETAVVAAKIEAAPLSLLAGKPDAAESITLPMGSLLPCETVLAVESHGESPLIARLSEDVWMHGKRIIREGTELHGRATIDETTARITAQGEWHLVGSEGDQIAQAVALMRSDSAEDDGIAGLPGEVIDERRGRDARIFSAAFLGSASTALQSVRTTAAELAVPSVNARNAALSGTNAVMREYIKDLREQTARNALRVRLPAGTPFHLYLTRPLTFSHAN